MTQLIAPFFKTIASSSRFFSEVVWFIFVWLLHMYLFKHEDTISRCITSPNTGGKGQHSFLSNLFHQSGIGTLPDQPKVTKWVYYCTNNFFHWYYCWCFRNHAKTIFQRLELHIPHYLRWKNQHLSTGDRSPWFLASPNPFQPLGWTLFFSTPQAMSSGQNSPWELMVLLTALTTMSVTRWTIKNLDHGPSPQFLHQQQDSFSFHKLPEGLVGMISWNFLSLRS